MGSWHTNNHRSGRFPDMYDYDQDIETQITTLTPQPVNTSMNSFDMNAIFWNTNAEKEIFEYNYIVQFLLAVFGFLCNLFVLSAFICIPSLRVSKTFLFFVSLSLADLLVCGTVMMLGIAIETEVLTLRSPGTDSTVCLLWMSLTIALCALSSFNVSVIAVDRCIWISNPLQYDVRVTRQRIIAALFLIWFLSFVVTFTASFTGSATKDAIAWSIPRSDSPGISNTTKTSSTVNTIVSIKKVCLLMPTTEYTIFVVIVVILLPCIGTTIVYVRIFVLVSQGIKTMMTNSLPEGTRNIAMPSSSAAPEGDTSSTSFFNPFRDSPSKQEIQSERSTQEEAGHYKVYFAPASISAGSSVDEDPSKTPKLSFTLKYHGPTTVTARISDSVGNRRLRVLPKPPPVRMSLKLTFVSAIRRTDVKAAGTLCIITGTYVICWLPFGIVSLVDAIDADIISPSLRKTFLWLAYSNSCWNPVIYTFTNKVFRNTVFSWILRTCCHRSTPPPVFPKIELFTSKSSGHSADTVNTASSFMQDVKYRPRSSDLQSLTGARQSVD